MVNLEGENRELIKRINEIKSNIIKNLSLKSAYYITTDNIDITLITKKIEMIIDKINEDLQKHFGIPKNSYFRKQF